MRILILVVFVFKGFWSWGQFVVSDPANTKINLFNSVVNKSTKILTSITNVWEELNSEKMKKILATMNKTYEAGTKVSKYVSSAKQFSDIKDGILDVSTSTKDFLGIWAKYPEKERDMNIWDRVNSLSDDVVSNSSEMVRYLSGGYDLSSFEAITLAENLALSIKNAGKEIKSINRALKKEVLQREKDIQETARYQALAAQSQQEIYQKTGLVVNIPPSPYSSSRLLPKKRASLKQSKRDVLTFMDYLMGFLWMIAGVVAVFGAFRVFGKFQNQDADAMNALGFFVLALLFLVILNIILKAVFT